VIGIIRLHGAVRPITEGGAEAADLPSPVFRNAINCTKCSGRMRRVMLDRCKVCHGSGRVPLYTAKGKLITECSTCSGRGELRVVRACPAVSEPGTICG
jgi:DnaJ-class molecular chaperone